MPAYDSIKEVNMLFFNAVVISVAFFPGFTSLIKMLKSPAEQRSKLNIAGIVIIEILSVACAAMLIHLDLVN